MPASTGAVVVSLVLPIRPRPSARSVPRWRSDWPIWLRTCVSFSFAIRSPPRLRARAACTGSTSLIDLPRAFATSSGRRSWRSACSAAFSMLIGFVVPSDFASTSRMPPSSSTARTPPPAITPVPGEAGRSSTRAASKRPSDSCVIVWPCFGDGEHVLLRVVDRLGDRERHLARLAVADADAIDLVADHDERREREAPAALDDLGDAVDLDHALLELSGLVERRVATRSSVLLRARLRRAP